MAGSFGTLPLSCHWCVTLNSPFYCSSAACVLLMSVTAAADQDVAPRGLEELKYEKLRFMVGVRLVGT